jgi:hypothetical protein
MVCQWFGLKITETVFFHFDIKIGDNGFLVEPQNQCGGGFFWFMPQN